MLHPALFRKLRFQVIDDTYTKALQIRRDLAKANPQAYLPKVARTLNNLGFLYKSEDLIL